MIARTLRGLVALALVALAMVGWPAALLVLADAVAVWLPDLANPAGLLSRPDTGGLFLVIVLGLGWIAWLVWTVALIVEAAAQIRGVPTPDLGGLFPQNATAALITTIAVAFTLAPTAPTLASEADTARTASTSTSHPAVDRAPAAQPNTRAANVAADDADTKVADEQGDYTVARGDTLWDIADEQLDDPTRWPEIAQDSEPITQPDGRHLTDPDLILPGWTLHLPDEPTQATPSPADKQVPTEATGAPDGAPTTEEVTPPSTPMQSTTPADEATATTADHGLTPPLGLADPTRASGAGRATSAGVPRTPALPSTPLSGARDHPATPPVTPLAGAAVYDAEARFAAALLGLPNWITAPLIPTRPEDAPELVSAAKRALAAARDAQR